jgi:hypothetical protein
LTNLDINTPKGQKTLIQEQRAVEIFCNHFTDVEYVNTPKNGSSPVDALLVNNNNLVGIVETKCRDLTRNQLTKYDDTWLITWDKIKKAQQITKFLEVPLWGFLYLVPDDLLVLVDIADANGEFLRPMDIRQTKTQRTVNGGTAIRENAYITITDCFEFTFDAVKGIN